METKIVVSLKCNKNNHFEIASLAIIDQLAGNIIIPNEKSIANMCLRRYVTKENWCEVQQILRDDYGCCANHFDVCYVRSHND